MKADSKKITAQKHAEKIIRKHGGKRISGGEDEGKWDMTEGVKREKAKAERQ